MPVAQATDMCKDRKERLDAVIATIRRPSRADCEVLTACYDDGTRMTVDDDAGRARERVVDGLHRIYGQMPGIEDVPVSGTPDDVVRGVREVIDAAADMILLNPVGKNVAEDREQMERLAAEVIPQLG